MRPILIRIVLDQPWLAPTDTPEPLAIGSAWFVVALASLYLAFRLVTRRGWTRADYEPVGWILGGLVLATAFVPRIVAEGVSVPIFGYGVMILVGFLAGTTLAYHRLRGLGYEGDLAFSIGTWILISGVIGGRVFYLVQHGGPAFADAHTMQQKFLTAINLTQGGLVLYGGVFAGLVAFFVFCWRHHIPALRMADVLTPSIFLGVGFGRLGCLLYGCCFGGTCDLPWAITFPPESIPYTTMVSRGVIEVGDVVPLHPTQVYSSISGFLLALLTGLYFRQRVGDGAVFALGCMTYPLARFLVEFLRNDELGQLGTTLTISQLISLGVVVAGTILFFGVSRRSSPAAAVRPNGAAA